MKNLVDNYWLLLSEVVTSNKLVSSWQLECWAWAIVFLIEIGGGFQRVVGGRVSRLLYEPGLRLWVGGWRCWSGCWMTVLWVFDAVDWWGVSSDSRSMSESMSWSQDPPIGRYLNFNNFRQQHVSIVQSTRKWSRRIATWRNRIVDWADTLYILLPPVCATCILYEKIVTLRIWRDEWRLRCS